MGHAVVMNMLEVHSDYHVTRPRTRHSGRVVGDGIASADAMEGRPSTDRGPNIPVTVPSGRPQRNTILAKYRAPPTPRAIESKGSGAFRRMPSRRTVKEALATSKLSSLVKRILRPTARGPELLPLSPVDVSADGASLVPQQRDRSQHTPIPEPSPPASHSHGIGFKKKMERCLGILKELVEEAVRWSKLSEPAGKYFDLIARDVEGRLIRLKMWASDDIEVGDPMFGDSSPSKLMDYVTNTLEGIMSAAEQIRKEMDFLGPLASQSPVKQTGKEVESVDPLAGQESVAEIEKEMEALASLAGQQLPGVAVDL